jgi:hypothetical protein
MTEVHPVRPAAEVATHRWLLDAAVLIVLTVLIGVVYWAVDAPLYNPSASIDPWVYTALFTNFDFTYHHFWDTYYASRLPWVVPGLLIHDAFSYKVAYLALHTVSFLGGGVALFVLARRFLGRLPAFVAYAALLGNQLYYTAETWDYVDGAVITYLLAALACGVTEARGRRRVLALFAGGFFLTAAIATNIFAVVFAIALPILYAAVNPVRGHARRLTTDSIAFASGSALLIVAGCAFAKANGAGWWFLEPQIRAVGAINTSDYRAPNYDWVVREPRLIAPLLVLIVGAFVLLHIPRGHGRERLRWRFAIGSYVYLLLTEMFLVVYQFTGGPVLQYPYYESLLFPAIALGLAAVVYAVVTATHGAAARSRLLSTSVFAALAPLLLVYFRDTKQLVGSNGTKITLAVAAVVVVLMLGGISRRWSARSRTAAAIILVALLLFGVNFSIAGSAFVFNNAASSPENGSVYDVGMQLVGFLRGHGFQRETPYFWYSEAEGPELIELQSLYYFSYTYLGLRMPRIDADFLMRERLYNPRTIVLLCRRLDCRGGPRALRAHGYRLHELGRRRLTSGPISIWARVFRVDRAT